MPAPSRRTDGWLGLRSGEHFPEEFQLLLGFRRVEDLGHEARLHEDVVTDVYGDHRCIRADDRAPAVQHRDGAFDGKDARGYGEAHRATDRARSG